MTLIEGLSQNDSFILNKDVYLFKMIKVANHNSLTLQCPDDSPGLVRRSFTGQDN